MNKIALIAGSIALAGTATAAHAVPDKPVHAALTWSSDRPNTTSSTGCTVGTGLGGDSAFDPDCTWTIIFKATKEDEFGFFIYRDQGHLQEGQTAPSTAISYGYDFDFGYGTCEIKVVVQPSGEYASTQICRAY